MQQHCPPSSKSLLGDFSLRSIIAKPVPLTAALLHHSGHPRPRGDPFTTWTHPKSKVFRLKDFLPWPIPDARSKTFGYKAAAAFGQSTAEIIDHAKSLIGELDR